MSWWGKTEDEEKEVIAKCNNCGCDIYKGDRVTGTWGYDYCSNSCKEAWEWKNIGDKNQIFDKAPF